MLREERKRAVKCTKKGVEEVAAHRPSRKKDAVHTVQGMK
jgi:hypothetical protein